MRASVAFVEDMMTSADTAKGAPPAAAPTCRLITASTSSPAT